uniref:Uncharacterized protein n=1 Tax=Tetranychus urticae TaxID=32264 RepID=T1L134_TETUR
MGNGCKKWITFTKDLQHEPSFLTLSLDLFLHKDEIKYPSC